MSDSSKLEGDPGEGRAGSGGGYKGTALDAAVEYVEGTLRALGAGARVFQKQIELKSLLDPAAKTGLLGTLLSSYATYFEGMAKVAGDAARNLRDVEESKTSAEK